MRHDCYLARLFQDRRFFQSGSATGHSHTVSIRPDLVTPLSVFLIPPVSSPCLDANGGIDLLEIGSSDWLTL